MKVTGIVCEYNPFHLGHQKQLRSVKADSAVVCLMSGNFIQRGAPAIFHKSLRAAAAIECGADLVLELPVTYALRSAEGFAAGGVEILSRFCDFLSFGTESGNVQSLLATAEALLAPDFSEKLRLQLDKGLSFPAARQAALGAPLSKNPNDILAVEYCKAILAQNSSLEIRPIRRGGSYHDSTPDAQNPSATAVRNLIASGEPWQDYVPEKARPCFENAVVHTLANGEKAILSRLRTMGEDEFASLPYGSEGLWRKFMHACREKATVEEILTATKSKRYTRTRLDRMLMCAFLGIPVETLNMPAPYVRVLGFNDTGREILKKARKTGTFAHVGQAAEGPYWTLEQRASDLYGLFAQSPEAPGREPRQRVCIRK